MENDPAAIRDPDAYMRTERSWPLIFIALGLAIWMLNAPLPYLLPYLISGYFGALVALTTFTLIAPVLYVIGIAEMARARMAGAGGRTKFSSIGGVTLLVGALYGSLLLAITLYQLFQLDIAAVTANPIDVIYYLLPLLSVAACLLGAYLSLKRVSFRGAMIAGAFSVFSGGGFFLLALVPIALDAREFRESGRRGGE